MNVTEKFIDAIKSYITLGENGRFEIDNILTLQLEHEGKRYALKIVELDAKLPKVPFCCEECNFAATNAQNRMTRDGWMKTVKED